MQKTLQLNIFSIGIFQVKATLSAIDQHTCIFEYVNRVFLKRQITCEYFLKGTLERKKTKR